MSVCVVVGVVAVVTLVAVFVVTEVLVAVVVVTEVLVPVTVTVVSVPVTQGGSFTRVQAFVSGALASARLTTLKHRRQTTSSPWRYPHVFDGRCF